MKNNQSCTCCAETISRPRLTGISGSHLERLSVLASARLASASKAADAALKTASSAGRAKAETNFHITPEGDALATTSFADGSTGDIVVRGSIAGIPYELHIRVGLEGDQVAVTLHLTKPLDIGPYTWRFDLGGVVKDASGRIVSVSSVTPSPDMQSMGLNWWCVLKCGGASILPTLVECVPAFAGGPAGYIACVTGKLGSGDAATIATCIASNCL